MDLTTIKRFGETNMNITAYLGMAISCPVTGTEDEGTRQVSKKMSQDRTHLQIHTDDFHTDTSNLNSVIWETMPILSPVRQAPAECDIDVTSPKQTMPVLSPVTKRCQNIRDAKFCPILNSTTLDSDDTSFATALSKTSSADRYFSALDIDQSDTLGDESSKENDQIEEFCDALETSFINTDVGSFESRVETEDNQDVRRNTGTEWTIYENHALKMKFRKTKNLNSQIHNAERQNTCIPRTVLRNIFRTKSNISERKSKADLYDKTSANEVEPHGQEMTKADFSVLDIRKYIIQQENITDRKFEMKHRDTDCIDCVSFSTNAHLQTQPEAVSPEAASPDALPRHPSESYFEKRHGSANKNLKRLFFCGCTVGKTRSSEKYQKTSKNKMKTRTRLSLGLSLKI